MPMPDGPGPLFDPGRDRVTDAAALGALAHPLRLRMLGLLRRYGPSTATRLAERTGESSGLTSHHLRQLAKGGFITDADPGDLVGVERSAGRERWWKAASRSTFAQAPPPGDVEAAAVSVEYLRAVLSVYADNARDWLAVAHRYPQPWQDESTFSDVQLLLTVAEAARLREELEQLLTHYRRDQDPGEPNIGAPAEAVRYAVQYQLFPRPDQLPRPDQPGQDAGGPAPDTDR